MAKAPMARPGTKPKKVGSPKPGGVEEELPRSLAVLWDRAERRPRGPAQALTLERIVAMAIKIADAEGLPSLSMARLAEKLGCAPMSLYRHVANKDELQVFMIDTAPGPPPTIKVKAGDWRAGLERWARELRAVYYRHPWILQLAQGRPPLEPGSLAWMDCGLGTLRGTRLEPDEKLSVILLALNYVRGEAQIATGVLHSNKRTTDEIRAAEAWYGRMMASLVDAERFPALAELTAARVFGRGGGGDPFEFGLARILDGLQAFSKPRS